MMFTEVLMEELARILIYVRKIFICRASFKLLRSSNFQNATFKKITISVKEVILIQLSFLTVGSKQKMKINPWNTMASLHHSKIRFTQNKGVPFFSCLDHGV